MSYIIIYLLVCYIGNVGLIKVFPWKPPKTQTDIEDMTYSLGVAWLFSFFTFPIFGLALVIMFAGKMLSPKA